MEQLQQLRPFTPAEHTAFLEALERFGEGSSGEEWQLIANVRAISNNSYLHCHAQLQPANLETLVYSVLSLY
jgi:hypothetical protein